MSMLRQKEKFHKFSEMLRQKQYSLRFHTPHDDGTHKKYIYVKHVNLLEIYICLLP